MKTCFIPAPTVACLCLSGLLISCDRPSSEADEPDTITVNVVGEVGHPGSFQVPAKAGTLTALAQAGWFAKFANRQEVRLIHAIPGQKPEISVIDFDKVFAGQDSDKTLQENCTIVVPAKTISF